MVLLSLLPCGRSQHKSYRTNILVFNQLLYVYTVNRCSGGDQPVSRVPRLVTMETREVICVKVESWTSRFVILKEYLHLAARHSREAW